MFNIINDSVVKIKNSFMIMTLLKYKLLGADCLRYQMTKHIEQNATIYNLASTI